ncbi:MAG: class I SAM-dependent methyltransferase [Deltaproteobacteria bacterium]|nr:class I SAM-dependent methyltransferase [Deltaproteobacteria bacterium]
MNSKEKKPSYFRPAFDILAPLYDFGVWLVGFIVGGEKKFRKLVIDELDIKKGQRVLEICCGTGTTAFMAGRMDAEIFGLDIAMGMLKTAGRKAARRESKFGLALANAESVPFKDRSFDRVVVSMGLHEMPISAIINTICEIRRVLKGGSKFVIFDYHKPHGLVSFLQRLFFVFTEHETARDFINFDIEGKLKDIGFKILKRTILAKGALQLITCEA